MFNKRNVIVIGVVIVGLIIFGAVFFSGQEPSNQPAGYTGKKTLSRDDAAKAIYDFFKNDKSGLSMLGLINNSINKTGTPNYDKTKGNFRTTSYGNDEEKGVFASKFLSAYESAGLIKIINKENLYGAETITYEFTDKAKPWLNTDDPDRPEVIFAQMNKVEVTGLTAPNTAVGVQIMGADYTIKYILTPFGEIYEKTKSDWKSNETKPSTDYSGNLPFVLYDDGWRIKQ